MTLKLSVQYILRVSPLTYNFFSVQDLLQPGKTDLPIREDADKNILVSGLAKKEIKSFEEFKLAFSPASNNRTTAATKLNNRSSRSHSILQLNVVTSRPCKKLHGKIYLIDLAGSEDNRRTGNQGIRLKESGAINKSLFALGEVVDAINLGQPRIPYRNSKLTRLLQDSVGGSCHSVMITNIAPEERCYYDTYCTLNFATKSKKIVNNTCTRETIVKPVMRKAPPNPDLPEEENKAKRQKMTALVAETPPSTQDPAPLLSPLMRRQALLEEAVNQRLAVMETNLMRQISASHPAPLPGEQTPRTKAIDAMRHQLEESYAQLRELATRHAPPLPPPDGAQTTAPSSAPQASVLQDKTNDPAKAADKKRPLCGVKRKKEEEFTCSPLFAVPARTFKRGFKSSASGSSLKELSSEGDAAATHTEDFNPALQQNRNQEFLHILNSSSVKNLQNLQTIGAKRAKLIFDWRETYGNFSHCEDLKKIPGFTDKYVQKLYHLREAMQVLEPQTLWAPIPNRGHPCMNIHYPADWFPTFDDMLSAADGAAFDV